jgi:hypothetical protein
MFALSIILTSTNGNRAPDRSRTQHFLKKVSDHIEILAAKRAAALAV